MLSYQHAYHAGSFADVHKHALVAIVLQTLQKKFPRLCVIDTHAGRGIYDLSSIEAQKTSEYQNGIGALWGKDIPAVSLWTDLVKKHNPDGMPTIYPGSPQIIKDMMGSSGRIILAELHPAEFKSLQTHFADAKNILSYNQNGLDILKANIPPVERHGLAVIDPSYEIKTEYKDIPRQILSAHRKWPQGVYCLWYPILKSGAHEQMLADLHQSGIRDILVSELRLHQMPTEGFAMYGTGMVIINPPLPIESVHNISTVLASYLGGQAETFWMSNKKIDADTGLLVT